MNSSEFQRVLRLIEEHQARFVDLKLIDLFGRLRHLTLPVEQFTPQLLEKGVGFDGSSYGFRKVESSDMVMLPDLATAQVDTFRTVPTVSLFGTVRLAEPGLPLADQDTRGILSRALGRMRSLGIADDYLVAPEYEFYIFRDVEADTSGAENYVRIDGEEGYEFNTYHLLNPADRYDEFRDRAVQLMMSLGMPVKYHHHETGGHGQQEIEFDLDPADSAGDHAAIVQYILRCMAHLDGLRITFMPKPLYGQPGNGWHVHQMLRKGGVNLFHDEQGPAGLSKTALHFIGGILSHGQALAGLTNPSTNSYKRLTSGFEAPVSMTFGPADRTAAVRIPRWAQGAETRVEYRPGDLTGNPNLTLAALLMAGLDGIENGIDAVAEGFGPAEDLAPEQIQKLPHSLDGALDALQGDREFLERGGVFPPAILDQWIAVKHQEVLAVDARPHPYEFKLYFDA